MGSLIPIGIAVTAVCVLLLLILPARYVRAAALIMAFGIASVSVNLATDSVISPASMILGILLLGISLLRVRSSPSGERFLQGTLVVWWVLVLASSLIMRGQSLGSVLVYGTFALLISHVALRLDPLSVRIFVRGVFVLMTMQILLAFLEVVPGIEPLWGRSGSRTNPFLGDNIERSQGTFGHPIVFGWFMAVCVVLVWVNSAKLSRMWRLSVLALALTGLTLSGTRSAFVAVAVGIGLHIIMRPGLSRWLRNILAAVGIVLIFLLIGGGSTVSTLTSELLDSGSWYQRLGNIVRMPLLLERPPLETLFGTGWGRDVQLFVDGYLVSPYHLFVVDNMFVEALGTLGIVGLLLLIGMIVVALVRGDRGSRAVTATITAMMFSFDTMVWTFTGVALMLFFSLPRLSPEPEHKHKQATEPVETALIRHRALPA